MAATAPNDLRTCAELRALLAGETGLLVGLATAARFSPSRAITLLREMRGRRWGLGGASPLVLVSVGLFRLVTASGAVEFPCGLRRNGWTVGALPRIVIASTVNGAPNIDLRAAPLGERTGPATDLRAGWAIEDFVVLEATDFLPGDVAPLVVAALAGGEAMRVEPWAVVVVARATVVGGTGKVLAGFVGAVGLVSFVGLGLTGPALDTVLQVDLTVPCRASEEAVGASRLDVDRVLVDSLPSPLEATVGPTDFLAETTLVLGAAGRFASVTGTLGNLFTGSGFSVGLAQMLLTIFIMPNPGLAGAAPFPLLRAELRRCLSTALRTLSFPSAVDNRTRLALGSGSVELKRDKCGGSVNRASGVAAGAVACSDLRFLDLTE